MKFSTSRYCHNVTLLNLINKNCKKSLLIKVLFTARTIFLFYFLPSVIVKVIKRTLYSIPECIFKKFTTQENSKNKKYTIGQIYQISKIEK